MNNRGAGRKKQTKTLSENVRKYVVSTLKKPKGAPPTFTSGDGKPVNTGKPNTKTDGNKNKK